MESVYRYRQAIDTPPSLEASRLTGPVFCGVPPAVAAGAYCAPFMVAMLLLLLLGVDDRELMVQTCQFISTVAGAGGGAR